MYLIPIIFFILFLTYIHNGLNGKKINFLGIIFFIVLIGFSIYIIESTNHKTNIPKKGISENQNDSNKEQISDVTQMKVGDISKESVKKMMDKIEEEEEKNNIDRIFNNRQEFKKISFTDNEIERIKKVWDSEGLIQVDEEGNLERDKWGRERDPFNPPTRYWVTQNELDSSKKYLQKIQFRRGLGIFWTSTSIRDDWKEFGSYLDNKWFLEGDLITTTYKKSDTIIFRFIDESNKIELISINGYMVSIDYSEEYGYIDD